MYYFILMFAFSLSTATLLQASSHAMDTDDDLTLSGSSDMEDGDDEGCSSTHVFQPPKMNTGQRPLDSNTFANLIARQCQHLTPLINRLQPTEALTLERLYHEAGFENMGLAEAVLRAADKDATQPNPLDDCKKQLRLGILLHSRQVRDLSYDQRCDYAAFAFAEAADLAKKFDNQYGQNLTHLERIDLWLSILQAYLWAATKIGPLDGKVRYLGMANNELIFLRDNLPYAHFDSEETSNQVAQKLDELAGKLEKVELTHRQLAVELGVPQTPSVAATSGDRVLPW